LAPSKAVAVVPLHITGFFRPYYILQDSLRAGSIGVGAVLGSFVVVRAHVQPADEGAIELSYGGLKPSKEIGSVRGVIERFREVVARKKLRVALSIEIPVRIGLGYGVSGAAALGTALALASVTRSSTMMEAARIAHIADVEAATGLGDVVAEFFGGPVAVRLSPGAPGIGTVDRLPIDGGVRVVTVELDEGYTTATLIADAASIPEGFVKRALEELVVEPSIERYVELSAKFSAMLGLNRRVPEKLSEVLRPSRIVGYYVKKNLVVVFVDEDLVADITAEVFRRGFRYRVFSLFPQGAFVKLESR